MLWEPWVKIDRRGLARYVSADVVQWLTLPVNRSDLLGQPGGRRALLEAIYTSLCAINIRYAPEKYDSHPEVQVIRTAGEILHAPREGTCLDLSLLFCGLCLGNGLLPLLVVVEGHAFVVVSLRHGPNQCTAFDRTEQHQLHNGVLTDAAHLRTLLDEESYIAIECTGFAHSTILPENVPEGAGREQGLLPFERATAAGREQLDLKGRSFHFAIDLSMLHYHYGIKPIYQTVLDLIEPFLAQLWEMVGSRVARRFREESRVTALREALTAGMMSAATRLPMTSETCNSLLTRFRDFVQREAVVEELGQIVDLRPDAVLDLRLLRAEFLGSV